MAGYSETPLWKKLGYRDGLVAHIEGAPPNYLALLDLPQGVEIKWSKRSQPGIAFVHLFTKSKASLTPKLKSFRDLINRDGVIWVSWPKKSAGVASDVTEDVIRERALPLGLVDVKVCAVDETWSGLKLVIRRELR